MARHDITDAATVEVDSDRDQVVGTYCLQFLCCGKNRWSSTTPHLEVVQHRPLRLICKNWQHHFSDVC